MYYSPGFMKFGLNLYPPFLGAGIKVEHISQDWREVRVSMAVRWYNRNAVGTHFGGSLYAMTDPHLMLLLMNSLGRDYFVWDQHAEIDYIKATRNKVFSTISITDEDITTIKEKTANGEKYLPEFSIDVIDSDKQLIATIKKTVYIKLKKRSKALTP